MGCDIHPIVQVRTSGSWQTVNPSDSLIGEMGFVSLEARNYDAFAILANVRNGSGFAGIVTGSGFTPISEYRGLPDDLKDLVDEEDDYHLPCMKHSRKQVIEVGAPLPAANSSDESRWDCEACVYLGDHSLTWVTLAELLEYPWHETTEHYGVIPARYDDRGGEPGSCYESWSPGQGAPYRYSGRISGPNIETWTTDEYEKRRDDGSLPEGVRIYVRVTWQEMNSEAAGDLYMHTIPWLKTLGAAEDVRIVMGFDS